jgi:hypothetical protein
MNAVRLPLRRKCSTGQVEDDLPRKALIGLVTRENPGKRLVRVSQ